MATGRAVHVFASGLKTVKLCFTDGTSDTVRLEAEVYTALVDRQDPDLIKRIQEEYSRSYGPKTIQKIVAAAPCAIVSNVDTNNNSTQVTEPAAEQPMTSTAQNEGLTGTGMTWKHEQVLLLLSLYAENRDKFVSSAYKQNAVWQLIAKQMASNGYDCDGKQCNEKFRALKYRHKFITDSNAKSGQNRRSWPFFDVMEDIMAGDPAVKPVRIVASSQCESAPITSHVEVQTGCCFRPISPQQQTSTSNSQTTRVDPPRTASAPPTSQTTRPPTPETPRSTTTPPPRSTTPQTSCTATTSQTPTTSRKRRRSSQDPPTWFTDFADRVEQRFTNLEAANNRFIELDENRNALFQQLVDILKNKNK